MTTSPGGAASRSRSDINTRSVAGSKGKSVVVIYAAVALDIVGIGLIIPILPQRLSTILQGSEVTLDVGILGTAYAVMQFLFAPLLGSLGDRFGRRPVFLFSIAGATVDYVLMAMAPRLGCRVARVGTDSGPRMRCVAMARVSISACCSACRRSAGNISI
ncbi:MAG: MFS transporter [Oxalobacteraceae bacterium]|nr:MAG: MFS transporter [Oxalobacteraceae bacterium]